MPIRFFKSEVSEIAGVVQWQNGSFPSCIRGFDSLRPLQLIYDSFEGAGSGRIYTSTKSNASRHRTTRAVDGDGRCAVHMTVDVSQKRPNSFRLVSPACAES
jgi:hypothetical protein